MVNTEYVTLLVKQSVLNKIKESDRTLNERLEADYTKKKLLQFELELSAKEIIESTKYAFHS